jgi:tyrosinase
MYVLTHAKSWDGFSNHTAESKREMDFVNSASLEGVHDTVHVLIVGGIHLPQL